MSCSRCPAARPVPNAAWELGTRGPLKSERKEPQADTLSLCVSDSLAVLRFPVDRIFQADEITYVLPSTSVVALVFAYMSPLHIRSSQDPR